MMLQEVLEILEGFCENSLNKICHEKILENLSKALKKFLNFSCSVHVLLLAYSKIMFSHFCAV